MTKREFLASEGYEDVIVFENPDYDEAIIGISHDDRVIYDYDKMIQCLVDNEGMDVYEAADFISYNTIRSLTYMGVYTPIVMFGFEE